jgi:hypothetical protein
MSIGDELRPVVVFRLVAAAMALRTPYSTPTPPNTIAHIAQRPRHGGDAQPPPPPPPPPHSPFSHTRRDPQPTRWAGQAGAAAAAAAVN